MLAALLALAAVQADPQAEAIEAAAALARCAVPRAQGAASGSEAAEAIADAALAACAEPEAQLRSILVRTAGEAQADATMQMAVTQLRARLIRVVTDRRGLTPRQDSEAMAWGVCIRASASRLATGSGAVETLADEVMRQCATEEAAERARLARNHEAATTDRFMSALITTLHDAAVQLIQQARASGDGRR